MKKNNALTLACVFLFVWVAGWSIAAYLWYCNVEVPKAAARVEAFQFRFGILKNDGNNNYSVVQETTTIPMTFGDSSYGFQIIPPDDASYSIQFISHFPYPPKTISGDVYESKTPSADMRSQKFQVQGANVQDLGFDPGDPVGEQSIEIWIYGKPAKTIKFTVTSPTNDQK